MVLLRSAKAEKTAESVEHIIDTLDRSGLEKDSVLVLGGGALAFAGIRSARDADVMIPHADYTPLAKKQRTPSGIPLRHKQNTTHAFLTTPERFLPPDTLSLDITHPHDADTWPSAELDEEFLRKLQGFDHVDGYHFLPPRLVAAHKATAGRRKDKRDIRLIRAVMRERND